MYLSRFNILCFSLDYSVFVLFAFVVLGLVFSVLCQEIGRDVNETLAQETETRPRHLVFGASRDRDQDLPAIPRYRDETETSDFCHETETETLQGRDRDIFRDLQPSALCQNNEWQTCLS